MKRFLVFVVLLVVSVLVWAHYRESPLPEGALADRIVVEKSARRLSLLFGGSVLKSYVISLGKYPEGKKEREGDGRTPEGVYRIDSRKSDSAFHLALHVSYPSAADVEAAKKRGYSPGGSIMIHGIRNGLGWVGKLHRAVDWTAGCIAVANWEIEEIWLAVRDGTVIEIRP